MSTLRNMKSTSSNCPVLLDVSRTFVITSRDMQAQFMKLVLRVNMQLTELRERPPAARASSSAGAVSGTGAGSWEKSGKFLEALLVMLTSPTLQGLLHLLLLLGRLHHHRLLPFLAGIPLERGPPLGLQALSAKTVLTMIATRVSNVRSVSSLPYLQTERREAWHAGMPHLQG